jgi:hypothetical protein
MSTKTERIEELERKVAALEGLVAGLNAYLSGHQHGNWPATGTIGNPNPWWYPTITCGTVTATSPSTVTYL